MSDSLVIIPTYKEKDNIERIIRKVFSLSKGFDVLIVDDNSPDGTAEIVESMMEEFKDKLFIEKRQGKLGLGTAYIHGFKWALKRDYEFIYEMDADFSHNPKDLVKLYEACKVGGADMSIGSRYISGVNVVNWPIGRVLMSYFASKYVRLITGMKIKDTTAGFKCYSRKVLEGINFDEIKFIGYAFQIEMKYLAYLAGFKIVEVPIVFTDRTMGVSKMSKGIFKEAIIGVLQLKIDYIFKRKYLMRRVTKKEL